MIVQRSFPEPMLAQSKAGSPIDKNLSNQSERLPTI